MKNVSNFKMISEAQKKMLPTEKDVVFYEENGFYISDCIIPEALIDKALKGAEEFYKGKKDFELSNLSGVANDDFDTASAIQNNEFVTLQKKELQDLGFYPMIGGVASILAKTNKIRLFADSLVNKLPVKTENIGAVGWHSDKAYWPTCTSENILTAWIPLQDCTIDMGPLTHIDGSNKWKNEAALKSFFSFNNQDLETFERYLETHKKGYKKTSMTLKKGQVSFHNCNTIHSSLPNVSTKNRLALAVHLQDASNSYKKAYKDNGDLIVIGYDKICSKDEFGNPNYADENLFPLIFER